MANWNSNLGPIQIDIASIIFIDQYLPFKSSPPLTIICSRRDSNGHQSALDVVHRHRHCKLCSTIQKETLLMTPRWISYYGGCCGGHCYTQQMKNSFVRPIVTTHNSRSCPLSCRYHVDVRGLCPQVTIILKFYKSCVWMVAVRRHPVKPARCMPLKALAV